VFRARTWFGCVAALVAALTIGGAAQIGGKPAKGNPTPGTPQPEPPNPADRITLTGCVEVVPGRTASVADANTPSDARFMLANAERQKNIPSGTGGSDLAVKTSGRTYRLEAIESQLSAFVGTKVEISGEVKPRPASSPGDAGGNVPTVQVEFVQKIAASCS
jgi:hypothetical protein